MNDRVNRYYNRFGAILTFFNQRLADFAAGSAVPGYVTSLAAVVAALKSLGADKVGGGDAGKIGALGALTTDLRNIHRTAASLAGTHPDLPGQFPLPEHSEQSVVATAGAHINALTPQPGDSATTTAAKTALVQLFLQHEMPATFVSDLQADYAAIDPAAEAQRTREQDKVKDTRSIQTEIQKGITLTNLLDAAAHNKYSRDPATLRAWQSASHLERAPKREKKSSDTRTDGTSSSATTPPAPKA